MVTPNSSSPERIPNSSRECYGTFIVIAFAIVTINSILACIIHAGGSSVASWYNAPMLPNNIDSLPSKSGKFSVEAWSNSTSFTALVQNKTTIQRNLPDDFTQLLARQKWLAGNCAQRDQGEEYTEAAWHERHAFLWYRPKFLATIGDAGSSEQLEHEIKDFLL